MDFEVNEAHSASISLLLTLGLSKLAESYNMSSEARSSAFTHFEGAHAVSSWRKEECVRKGRLFESELESH